MIVINVEDSKPFKSVDGSEIAETVGVKTTGTEEVSLARATVKPNRKTEEHYHDFLEIYLIERGNGRMKTNSEVRDVRMGDSIIIPKKSWHSIKNASSGELVIWCICVPAFSEDGTAMR